VFGIGGSDDEDNVSSEGEGMAGVLPVLGSRKSRLVPVMRSC
jgi:hypothetical protein